MKLVLTTGISSLLILVGSFVFVSGFDELSSSQSGGLGFLMFPVLVLAGVLSLFSILEWIKLIKQKRSKSVFEYLIVLPSLPMVGLGLLLILFLVYRG